MVAFGMVGASVSGVSFVGVPGMALQSGMAYLEICFGFIFGYVFVAFVLLPLYYRANVTTIYSLLKPLGNEAYKTGSGFFIISKLVGSAAKFYVPCFIISRLLGWHFTITILFLLGLIWLYTRRGGIKTLVWTDVLHTSCMIGALILIIYNVSGDISSSLGDITHRMIEMNAIGSGTWVRVLSGMFIVIVMTGLDQDMMQKNLTCKSLRDAQKDMCVYGVAFLPVNALLLMLGTMLMMLCEQNGTALPEKPDDLLTGYIFNYAEIAGGMMPQLLVVIFLIAILASSFSTIDSALTALTTSFCIDVCERHDDEKLRKRVHLVMALLLIAAVMMFNAFNTTSLIDAVYTMVSYTYGPLLGLFCCALLHKKVRFPLISCIISPLACFTLSYVVKNYCDYTFGYELLMINGLLIFCLMTLGGRLARI